MALKFRPMEFFVALTAAVLCLVFLISFQHAYGQETGGDLRSTIRAALLSDPRSSEMSEAELETMVNALAVQAEDQGVTADDITWRPQAQETFASDASATGTACGFPAFMCSLNQAFGFDDSSLLIPTGFGITSALLLFVIGMMIEHHRHKLSMNRPLV